MGFDKSELLEEIKSKRIDFPSGQFLLIDYRARVMPYRKRKLLMDSVLNIQSSGKRLKSIQKELENKSLGEVNRERLEDEIVGIMRMANEASGPLVDYLGGSKPDEARPRPPAIVKWDLTNNGAVVPVNREEIEDLDPETLSFIAWELLNAGDVGEAKGTPSAPLLPSEATGVPV